MIDNPWTNIVGDGPSDCIWDGNLPLLDKQSTQGAIFAGLGGTVFLGRAGGGISLIITQQFESMNIK